MTTQQKANPMDDINSAIKTQTSFELAELLAPISSENPCGENLRHSETFKAIKQAREADDPSIPRGEWAHDLKKANWADVIDIAANALVEKSKDLQVAIWLCEAQVNQFGFAGIAPGFRIVEQLCRHYWEGIYPQPEGGDQEYRTNVLHWANEKFLPLLITIPLTPQAREPLTWENLEVAMRNEQIQAQGKGREVLEGFSVADCLRIISQTSSQELSSTLLAIDLGVNELRHLAATLNELCGDESPSLGAMTDLLGQMAEFLSIELHKRGYSTEATNAEPAYIDEQQNDAAQNNLATPDPRSGRTEAYAQLEMIADYLAYIEPHSPVPNLLKRMVEWGNMNTSDLYRQLFVQSNGQINIFEVLGLDKNAA
jgi:type VI secretion system protein ImpA